MLRWDTTWSRIETKEISRDANFTYFEAITNAFSPFAIAAKVPEIVPTKTPASTLSPTITPPSATPTSAPTISPASIPVISWHIIMVAIVASAIIVSVAYLLRKKSEK